jgi:hypothetical protein
MYFIDIFEFESATAAAIVQVMSALVAELIAAGATVVASVTDNGANLVRAFNPLLDLTVQTESGAFILRISCGVHTTNLVLVDLARVFPVFGEFVDWLRSVINFLHLKNVKAAVRMSGIAAKIPHIQDAKWNTVVKSAAFMWEHMDTISGLAILHDFEWFEPPLEYRLIVDALMALRMFTEAAEGDQVILH